MLAQLCEPDQSAGGKADLVSLLYWPLQQLHQYSRMLLKLAACYDVVRKLTALWLLFFSLSALSLLIASKKQVFKLQMYPHI